LFLQSKLSLLRLAQAKTRINLCNRLGFLFST